MSNSPTISIAFLICSSSDSDDMQLGRCITRESIRKRDSFYLLWRDDYAENRANGLLVIKNAIKSGDRVCLVPNAPSRDSSIPLVLETSTYFGAYKLIN